MGNSTYGWFLIGLGVLLLVVSLLTGTSSLGWHPSFGWLQEVASPLERRPGFEWLPEAGVIIGILAIVVGFYLRRVTGLLQVVETVRIGAHRGRPLLAVTAALSLAFGGLVLVRAPGDLMTLALYFAAYGLLLGALRIAVAMRLDSPQLI